MKSSVGEGRPGAEGILRGGALPPGVVPTPRIRGVGLLTGWGDGLAALSAARPEAATGLVTVPTPALAGERFRRATRECLLAVAAVRAAAADGGLDAAELGGGGTGILYVSATGYAAANRAFLQDESSTTLHFPYTSPSAVPGEVTIEFGIRGPYVNLMGGGTAALQGLWYAARWLADGIADRVILLAVEAVHEVRDLFARARRLYAGPLIEGAACLVLAPGGGEPLRWASTAASGPRRPAAVASVLDAVLGDRAPRIVASGVSARGAGGAEALALARRGLDVPRTPFSGLGEALACGPLVGLAQAQALDGGGPCLLTAAWRNDYGAMLWAAGGGHRPPPKSA